MIVVPEMWLPAVSISEKSGSGQLARCGQRRSPARTANCSFSSSERRFMGRSVKNGPGAMQFTVTPNGPRSIALARASPMRPVLVAQSKCCAPLCP